MPEEISIIFTIYPFVYCLKSDKKRKFCDFCFKKLSKPCSCPICYCMHYCNRDCEKQDTIHKYECQNFCKISKKPELKKVLEDEIFGLFLRILIKFIKINDLDSENYLELINSCDQNYYKSMAIKYMNEVSVLMGDEFMAFFDEQEIVTFFDKMMVNKIEIKSDGETIGFGIYLEYSFDDSDKSNTEIYFDGLKVICKVKLL